MSRPTLVFHKQLNTWTITARLRADSVYDVLSVPHRTTAIALLRICMSVAMLLFYLGHARQAMFLWGPHGAVPLTTFSLTLRAQRGLTLFQLSAWPGLVWPLYILAVVSSVSLLLGYRTQLSAICFYLTTWSFFERNTHILVGGDNLLCLFAFFLMFTDSGCKLSLDSVRSRNQRLNPYRCLLHNVSVAAMVVQLCIVYISSGFYKAGGELWSGGTALYYILRSTEFQLTTIGKVICNSPVLVTVGTYATILFQLSWPFLIWRRRTKVFAACGAVAMHLSIAYIMGLFGFSFVMIAAELVIFDDDELRLLMLSSKKHLEPFIKRGVIACLPSGRRAGVCVDTQAQT